MDKFPQSEIFHLSDDFDSNVFWPSDGFHGILFDSIKNQTHVYFGNLTFTI